MRTRWIPLLLLLAVVLPAADVEFKASINADRIGLDDLLIYTVTFKGIENPQQPDVSAITGFRVLQTSRSSQFRFVNGASSYYTNFEFYLKPQKKGIITIPPVSYRYRGDTFETEAFRIEVVEGSLGTVAKKKPARSPLDEEDFLASPFKRRSRPQEIDVRLDASVSKKSAVVGEQIIYTILLITRNRIESVNPVTSQSFPGFWSEWFPVPTSIDGTEKMIKGKQYYVYEIRKAALFPRETGRQTIPAFRFELGLVDDSLAFFSTPRKLHRESPEIDIQVSNPPQKARGLPVGDFKFSIQADKDIGDVNDILTLRMQIRGRGNIKTLMVPELKSQDSFKVFPAKITRKYDFSRPTLQGRITAEIPLSFKKAGDVSFPSLSFSYYDVDRDEVVQLKSVPLSVRITGTREEVSSAVTLPRSEIVREGEDVDFIKKGGVSNQNHRLYRSGLFSLLLFIPFVWNGLFLLKKKVVDPLVVKSGILTHKKALNNAQKRLRDVTDYGDIHDILERYLLDRTGLGFSELSNQNIEDLFRRKQMSDYDMDMFIRIKSKSESSRFSPHSHSRKEIDRDVRALMAILKRIDRQL